VQVVLIVEDDCLIQILIEDALADGGFRTVTTSSGEHAMTFLATASDQCLALITDIDLGRDKSNGWTVAQHARDINADLPVVYISGDHAGDWAQKGVPLSVMLEKPFVPRHLVKAVSQLLPN
jgi:DNA-binding NtrC family response regulator